jgi:hypothetical protein
VSIRGFTSAVSISQASTSPNKKETKEYAGLGKVKIKKEKTAIQGILIDDLSGRNLSINSCSWQFQRFLICTNISWKPYKRRKKSKTKSLSSSFLLEFKRFLMEAAVR